MKHLKVFEEFVAGSQIYDYEMKEPKVYTTPTRSRKTGDRTYYFSTEENEYEVLFNARPGNGYGDFEFIFRVKGGKYNTNEGKAYKVLNTIFTIFDEFIQNEIPAPPGDSEDRRHIYFEGFRPHGFNPEDSTDPDQKSKRTKIYRKFLDKMDYEWEEKYDQFKVYLPDNLQPKVNASGTTYGPAYATTQSGTGRNKENGVGAPIKAGGF